MGSLAGTLARHFLALFGALMTLPVGNLPLLAVAVALGAAADAARRPRLLAVRTVIAGEYTSAADTRALRSARWAARFGLTLGALSFTAVAVYVTWRLQAATDAATLHHVETMAWLFVLAVIPVAVAWLDRHPVILRQSTVLGHDSGRLWLHLELALLLAANAALPFLLGRNAAAWLPSPFLQLLLAGFYAYAAAQTYRALRAREALGRLDRAPGG